MSKLWGSNPFFESLAASHCSSHSGLASQGRIWMIRMMRMRMMMMMVPMMMMVSEGDDDDAAVDDEDDDGGQKWGWQ